MKKAEDYIDMSRLSYKSNLLRLEIIKSWIRQAQEDAIKEALADTYTKDKTLKDLE